MADLSMFRGDDKTWNLTFTDSNGTAINLTSATIFLTVKKNTSDADTSAVISKTVTAHTNPTGGISALTVTHTDSAIAIGNYYYDIQLVDSAGSVTTITNGSFTIKRDITVRTS